MGYAEAKWVCERIMENAVHSRQGEIQPIVVRIGQISVRENRILE
jgi:thioester reductase-like protein